MALRATAAGDGKHDKKLYSLESLYLLYIRIFILEGLFTVVVAVASKFLIVDWPETCKSRQAFVLPTLCENMINVSKASFWMDRRKSC